MTRVMTWRDSTGAATVFDGSAGIFIYGKPLGLEAPTPVNTVEDYIAFDGAALTNRRRNVRPMALPIMLEHATRVETVTATLASIITKGAGQLQIADGTNTRYLKNVIYESGINGAGDVSVELHRTLVLSLIALDPWWYDPAVPVALPIGAATAFDAAVAFDAVLPFDGGASVSTVVVGDTDAFPVITVNGPATSITVGAGGLDWTTAVALGASDVLVVDTRPGSRGPRLNGGAVNWALLTAASRLWTLPVGTTSVIVGVAGSTGATSATLSYEPRWSTP